MSIDPILQNNTEKASHRWTRRVFIGAVWFISIVEALAMSLAGVAKFSGSRWQELFVIWGYPDWFSYVIGVAEILGALGLLVPRIAPWAAGFLGVIMTAATATVLAHPGTLSWRASAIHLLILVFIGVARLRRKDQVGARGNGTGSR